MSTQPFASPEEALAHYGKKGMKWGVRNDGPEGGRRRATTQEIVDARIKTAARFNNIAKADIDVRLATTKAGKEAALKIVEKNAKEIMTTDDQRVANMFTKGERVAHTIAFGPLGLLVNRVNTKVTSEERFRAKARRIQGRARNQRTADRVG